MSGIRNACETLVAALLAGGAAVLLARATGLPSSVAITAVAIVFLASRTFGDLGERRRFAALPVFAVVSVLAAGIGSLLLALPAVGAVLFSVAVSASIWARRFGPRGSRIARIVAAPFLAILIVPAPVATELHGPARLVVVPAIGLGAVAITAATMTAADRILGVTPHRIPESPAQLRTMRPETSHPVETLRNWVDAARRNGWRGMAASTRMAVQMLVTLLLAFGVGFACFGVHWPWVVITGYIVLVSNRGRGDAVLRGVERLIGAVAGATIGALTALVPAPDGVRIALIFVFLAVGIALRPRSYVWWAAALTAALALLYGLLGQTSATSSDVQTLAIRLVAIVVGGAIAGAAAWWVFPIRSADVLRRRVADALIAVGDALRMLRERPDAFPASLAQLDAASARLAEVEHLHRTLRRLAQVTGKPVPAGIAALAGLRELDGELHRLSAAIDDGRLDPSDRVLRRATGVLQRQVGALRSINGRRDPAEPSDPRTDALDLGALSLTAAMLDGLQDPLTRLARRQRR